MTGPTESRRPIRIANCSGFYGDRLAAAREMVDGGPIDVLTGDWLAELTMTILARSKLKGGRGYAGTFVTQVRDVLTDCVSAGIRIVSNAGGLDPLACAAAIREFAPPGVKVAVLSGDDLTSRIGDLRTGDENHPPEPFVNLDTGEAFDAVGWPPLTANAAPPGRTSSLRGGSPTRLLWSAPLPGGTAGSWPIRPTWTQSPGRLSPDT